MISFGRRKFWRQGPGPGGVRARTARQPVRSDGDVPPVLDGRVQGHRDRGGRRDAGVGSRVVGPGGFHRTHGMYGLIMA